MKFEDKDLEYISLKESIMIWIFFLAFVVVVFILIASVYSKYQTAEAYAEVDCLTGSYTGYRYRYREDPVKVYPRLYNNIKIVYKRSIQPVPECIRA